MQRRILGAALAMGALLAGQQATQSQPAAEQAKLIAGMGRSIEQAKQHRPEPAKPAVRATAPRQVVMRPSDFAGGDSLRFFPVQERRKVKRGKHSWVII